MYPLSLNHFMSKVICSRLVASSRLVSVEILAPLTPLFLSPRSIVRSFASWTLPFSVQNPLQNFNWICVKCCLIYANEAKASILIFAVSTSLFGLHPNFPSNSHLCARWTHWSGEIQVNNNNHILFKHKYISLMDSPYALVHILLLFLILVLSV